MLRKISLRLRLLANCLGRSLPLFVLLLLIFGRAQAATIELRAGPSGHTLILISGRLEIGDELKFKEVSSGVTRATVYLAGPGGNVRAARDIGMRVRLRRFATVVSSGAQCASACGLVWLAGVKRFVAPSAQIGFHAVYRSNDAEKRESGAGNALVGAYLNEISLPEKAIIFITERPPHGMNWLTAPLARERDIEIEPYDAKLDAAWASAIAPQTAAGDIPPGPGNDTDRTGSIPDATVTRRAHVPQATPPTSTASAPLNSSVTPEQMILFVVGPNNSVDRAIRFYSYDWDEKVKYIKGVGGQYSKKCFSNRECIHRTEALTPNRNYAYAVRSNTRTGERAFCVTSLERGRKACYSENGGDVLFLYSSGGKWKEVAYTTALSMIP
jgi:hypothetical protein